ncbi:MAG: nucleoside deaminase [Bacilli bacterium]
MKNEYMKLALIEAKKSLKSNDVPVGAIIVKDGIVLAKAHNKREKNQLVTNHAEIIAIEKACKKLNSWHLDDCILYVTLEPCLMCYGAIIQSRISKIFYAASSEKTGFFSNIPDTLKVNLESEQINNLYTKESSEMLKVFFKDKRN